MSIKKLIKVMKLSFIFKRRLQNIKKKNKRYIIHVVFVSQNLNNRKK